MKLLILSGFCFCSFLGFSQTHQNEQLKTDATQNDSLYKRFQNFFRKQEFTVHLPSEKNKIIALPQDHMPCIIPDTKDIAAIPNGWSRVTIPYRSQYHPIPNPGLLPRVFRYDVSDQWKNDQTK